VAANDLVGIAGAVRPSQFSLLFAPQQQMPVVVIELIQIRALAGAFACVAESKFPESPYLFDQAAYTANSLDSVRSCWDGRDSMSRTSRL